MTDPVYRLQQLEHGYDGRIVLSVDTLTIRQGEILALVGPSGAGKSTLLRLLALLERPRSGALTLNLDGQHIPAEKAALETRRQIAMVFQRPFLLSRSVISNVAYGLKVRGQHDPAAIEQMLERVALGQFRYAQALSLSGGEMQRMALARALVVEPRVLLLDEPSANLDPYNVRLIEDLIREQNQLHGTTIVLVTHNIFQAQRLAQRVGLLLDGRMIELAETEAFFNQPQDERTRRFISGDYVY
jgi:tungstate transport system ATP-binding protein